MTSAKSKSRTDGNVDEFQLIDSLKKFQSKSSRVIKGIGDDAAVMTLDAKRYQLLTTDMLVEDVHFLRSADPRAIGHKAMACNISDIAAMGGVPTFAVVSVGVPPEQGAGSGELGKTRKCRPERQDQLLQAPNSMLQAIYRGMKACADRFNVTIVGGDTVKSDKLVINVALLGEVEKKHLVLRSGAKPGDRIFVTGPLGGSLLSGRHLNFPPRIREARFLVEHFKPSAMMDISDGLAGDLGHILKESGAGARIDAARIPLNHGVTPEGALRDGEDFELLFTLSSAKAHKLLQYFPKHTEYSFFEIGEVTSARGKLLLRDENGCLRQVATQGFEHF